MIFGRFVILCAKRMRLTEPTRFRGIRWPANNNNDDDHVTREFVYSPMPLFVYSWPADEWTRFGTDILALSDFAGSSRGDAFSPYPYRACAHKRRPWRRGRARHVSGQRGHGRRGDHDRGIHVWQAVTVWLAPGAHACPAGLPGFRSRAADKLLLLLLLTQCPELAALPSPPPSSSSHVVLSERCCAEYILTHKEGEEDY